MQARLGLFVFFAAVLSTSLAAPVNDVTHISLTPRGRVRDKLQQFREGAGELVCNAKVRRCSSERLNQADALASSRMLFAASTRT